MRTRNKGEVAKLEMTPMIDVVFQLLIFFIVTLSAPEILSHLNISRPATPDIPTPPGPEILTIQISPDGWVLNGSAFAGADGFVRLEQRLARIASFSPDVSVMIKCTADSPHAYLIRTLNACAREDMPNISVFSL